MAESEKAPEQQAPAKVEGIKNDSAATPPATEEQQPKQIIGEFENNQKKKHETKQANRDMSLKKPR